MIYYLLSMIKAHVLVPSVLRVELMVVESFTSLVKAIEYLCNETVKHESPSKLVKRPVPF